MKKILILLCLCLSSSVVMASDKEQWMCTGYGVVNTGGPSGPIVIPTQGRGDTEFDAVNQTLQNCRQQGLQMCSISSCYKR